MSSKVCAYNQYCPENNEEEVILELTYGLFFDGTKNNRRNTEIRKKVNGLDDYGNPSQDEKNIYNEEAKKFSFKSFSRKERGNDSFANDFTNVARMSLCLDEIGYAIYIEGAGTEDEKGDSFMGYAFGGGKTGIRGKVRKGCELLAEKIFEKKRGIVNLKRIRLDIDAYGFSRGAAAARNFLYEIQKKEYKPSLEVRGKYSIRLVDSDGEQIKRSCLKDGKLPPFGHLGIALLDAGFSQEEIEKVKLYPRFIGVYDTVSSYSKNISLFPDFDDVEELHLNGVSQIENGIEINSLGRVKKAVHFTAQDEHRENFSLTRMRVGIEKNLPGVHSDIGGGYNSKTENVEIDNGLSKARLKKLQSELIGEGWFKNKPKPKPKQIVLIKREQFLAPDLVWVLNGIRDIKKEYSYIPLHFMREHADEYIKDYIIKNVETTYSIDKEIDLVQAKAILRKYVMEDGEEWIFIPDKEIAHKKALKEVQEAIIPELTGSEQNAIELEVVVIGDTPQELLRKLRNKYLHWSADKGSIGMEPRSKRIRTEY